VEKLAVGTRAEELCEYYEMRQLGMLWLWVER